MGGAKAGLSGSMVIMCGTKVILSGLSGATVTTCGVQPSVSGPQLRPRRSNARRRAVRRPTE